MLFKDLCLSHFAIFCQQTCELWKCRWPFLLPSIEIAIQRLDKLNPSLNIIIFKLREALETRSKSKMSHPPSTTCTVARRKAGFTAFSHFAARPSRIHLNSTWALFYCNIDSVLFTLINISLWPPQHLKRCPCCTSSPLPSAWDGKARRPCWKKSFARFETNRNPSSESKIKRILIF